MGEWDWSISKKGSALDVRVSRTCESNLVESKVVVAFPQEPLLVNINNDISLTLSPTFSSSSILISSSSEKKREEEMSCLDVDESDKKPNPPHGPLTLESVLNAYLARKIPLPSRLEIEQLDKILRPLYYGSDSLSS